MANKDYVKRGRGSTQKPVKKTSSRKLPWRAGALAVVLVTGFSYGLYLLGNTPEPPMPVAQAKPEPQPKPSKAIPPPPEEKWEYVESLPNREVEVIAKEQTVSKIPYTMQCGAYKLSAQAEERKLAIAFQGISSNIVKKEGSSWYRIMLGPYTSKRDAERDRHKLQRAKIEPCAIWKQAQ